MQSKEFIQICNFYHMLTIMSETIIDHLPKLVQISVVKTQKDYRQTKEKNEHNKIPKNEGKKIK